MQRTQVKIALLTLMLAMASVSEAVAQGAMVSGVVRDAQGVAQMGALVQVLRADSSIMGAAFTDLHGRYIIANLVPGHYDVKASAALFMPASRNNLHLRSGAEAVVNLTLNTLFEPSAWLPAERRKADEPDDDWKWTLRSAANRPILRLNDDGKMVVVSSSLTEPQKRTPVARASLVAGDGGFGANGLHNVLLMERTLDDGANVVMRADYGTMGRPYTGGPSTSFAGGYERAMGFAGASRMMASYQSHPEMVGSGNVDGMRALQMVSAERMKMGDMADVEAGSTLYVVQTNGYATAVRPFLKITAHPGSWTAGYRVATSQDVQSYSSLDAVEQPVPVAVMSRGRLQTAQGTHQEFSAGHKVGKGLVQVAYYLDSQKNVMIAGGGALTAADIQGFSQTNQGGIVADATTGEFRVLSAGYKTRGIDMTFSEPITPAMWLALAYSTGAGMEARDESSLTLPAVATDMTPRMSQALTLAVKGRIIHSGTQVRASYRWQPAQIVTAVNPYGAFGDQAYFSCYLRQAIRLGNLLPAGMEATVDITNLLAQGYRPVMTSDGHMLFLAQAPRTVQGGLAFNF
ncbi:hypothetical protein GCM10011507_07180 [Edaphobacter acidisoli]|uniref:Carboxypeptidase regulatory-like domain-containing protein n=1 Tax=Edaphobacter acidisoli TaxID=2040573 RepID=A0A916RJG6_9BACT|nr:carboxypeptidase-like regulatory domain-containing protein [Edaphobacter acidisoli]GGA58360.1 hypothetical protein GCM10011507_07180 [Edaphobacter acidisoli]